MRYLTIAALVVLAATFASAEEWEHKYQVTGKPELFVDTNDGDIEVSTGSGQQVAVRIVTHGIKINDDLKINATQSGNHVELRLHRNTKVCFGFCHYSVRVEISVPRESDLDVHSGDGALHVENVRGNLQLQTNDGDIRLHDIEGALHANTHDGNIDVNGRFDMLNLRTSDGNIDARVSAAPGAQAGWSLHTGDGNIRLTLPDNFAADIDAHTGDGSVRVDFPITTSGSTQENVVRGKINGGGISIELQTGDGDVRVVKG